MAIGGSGRVVIEVDPDLKRQLHAELARQGTTLKAWFLSRVEEFLNETHQPRLPFGQDGTAADATPASGDDHAAT